MKTKLFLIAAALSSGLAMLGAEDAPKPPDAPRGEGRPGVPPAGGDPQARFEEAFKKMDANADGKVSKEEFLEFSKKEAEERFSKIDASGSGSVSKDQIAEAMRRMRGGEGGQRRPEGFRRPEGEAGSGGVRRPEGGDGARPRPGGEGNATPGGNPPPPPGEGRPDNPGGPSARGGQGGGLPGSVGEMFRKIQENGSISKEEYSKLTDEQFKRMDGNADGKITKEELEELGRKMRDLRGGQGAPGGPPQGGEGGIRRRPEGDGGAPRPEGDRPKRPEAN
jgi:Ca2+-binding EF-hand superfamily protein